MTRGRLEAQDVVYRHDAMLAVDHVDLVAEPGLVTAVIGPNGAGKTTLFDCLSGVRTPESGRVLLDGVDITSASTDDRARRGVARTFQHSSVFATLTVEENLRVGAENRRRGVTWREFVGLREADASAASAVVESVAKEMELTEVRDVVAGHLPTGTLRVVELARALCTRPSVLLLDEPASGLDTDETDRLCALLRRQAAMGLAVLLIEHDITLVRDAADVVYAMVDGRMLGSGPTHEVLDRSDVRTRALGLSR
jgi:branched-chain amino acid transport system ATP-binding protein